jgi:hypothetical protein
MSRILMTSQKQCWGDYYGYPSCCIKAFHRMLLKDLKFNEISVERQSATKHGFVPCKNCAIKIVKGEIMIETLIQPTRQCPKPFS